MPCEILGALSKESVAFLGGRRAPLHIIKERENDTHGQLMKVWQKENTTILVKWGIATAEFFAC